ncbi:MAG: exonuclease domain-containing protein [bacterium]|nr:exonuclease domain-containing protein [bacterium]
MSRRFDKIVVVDVEATCWQGSPPKGEQNEIIEIGICLLDIQTSELSDNRCIMVKPVRSRVSEFCTELTTLTQEDVDKGVSFKEACDILKKDFLSKSRVWASYGAYDLNQFTKQCKEDNIDYPFGPRHINVKTLFSLKHKLKKEVGMAGALRLVEIPLEGTHHRGVDDARNIALILKDLLNS